MKRSPRYQVFKTKTSVPVFSTNWRFLATCYASYCCKNYARIEKFVEERYQLFWKATTQLWPPITKYSWDAPLRARNTTMDQYRISTIDGRRILIAASEFGWIYENGSKDETWAEIAPSEMERTSQLVYGSFLWNPSQVTGSLDPKSLNVMQGMEMAYVHFEPQPNGSCYSWRSLRVMDVEILDDQPKIDCVAFAVIIDVAKEVPRTRNLSISAFPYNSGITVQQNIATRSGLLAINDLDRRNQRRLQDTNWRLLVDRPRARRAAARVALSVAAYVGPSLS